MAKGPKPPTPEELLLADAQRLTTLWIQFRNYFAKAVSEEPLTREDEQGFLESKSEIQKLQRGLGQRMPPGLTFGADRLADLLRHSITLGHLRALPKTDRMGLFSTWHHVFIYLSQATGALQFISEGYSYDSASRTKKAAGTNMSDLKGASAHKKAAGGVSKQVKMAIAIVLIAAIGAGLYFFVLA